MTGSSTGGRSSEVAAKSILNHPHHTTDSSIPRSLLKIGVPVKPSASCSSMVPTRLARLSPTSRTYRRTSRFSILSN